jgi:hypothetical protein
VVWSCIFNQYRLSRIVMELKANENVVGRPSEDKHGEK